MTDGGLGPVRTDRAGVKTSYARSEINGEFVLAVRGCSLCRCRWDWYGATDDVERRGLWGIDSIRMSRIFAIWVRLSHALPRAAHSCRWSAEELAVAQIRDFNLSTLLGRFNPLIFSPEWLHTNGVIGPNEAESCA